MSKEYARGWGGAEETFGDEISVARQPCRLESGLWGGGRGHAESRSGPACISV